MLDVITTILLILFFIIAVITQNNIFWSLTALTLTIKGLVAFIQSIRLVLKDTEGDN